MTESLSNQEFILQGKRTPLRQRSGTYNLQHKTIPSALTRSDSLLSSSTASPQTTDLSTVSSTSLPKGWPEHEIDAATMQKSVTFTKTSNDIPRSNKTSSKSHNPIYKDSRRLVRSHKGLSISGSSAFTGMNGSTVVNGDILDSDHSESRNGIMKSHNETQWYTNPIHLHKNGHMDNTNDKDLDEHATVMPAYTKMPLSPSSDASMDVLAKKYFPYTLGAAYMVNDVKPQKPLSSPGKGLPQPDFEPWITSAMEPTANPKRSRSPIRKRSSRPTSARSSSSDKMFFVNTDAPHIASAGELLLSSPYQSELARLRMERLRIEEEHLLEVKRQEEMERIRGPTPKWYELKSPRFHYEAKKNTEILKNRDQWQQLMDYRNDLENASKEFHKSYDKQLSSSS